MVMNASSVSRATTASASAASHARVKRSTMACSARDRGAGAFGSSPEIDSLSSGLEHLRHLSGWKTEYIAEHDHGKLPGREELQRSHERQRDGLELVVSCLGTPGSSTT